VIRSTSSPQLWRKRQEREYRHPAQTAIQGGSDSDQRSGTGAFERKGGRRHANTTRQLRRIRSRGGGVSTRVRTTGCGKLRRKRALQPQQRRGGTCQAGSSPTRAGEGDTGSTSAVVLNIDIEGKTGELAGAWVRMGEANTSRSVQEDQEGSIRETRMRSYLFFERSRGKLLKTLSGGSLLPISEKPPEEATLSSLFR